MNQTQAQKPEIAPQHCRALVLIVDPQVESRHWLWRLLSKAFGVLEAKDVATARRWIDERPDIDALIIEDELPGVRGSDLVKELGRKSHPIASRSIIIASEWRRVMLGGLDVVERGDMKGILQRLTTWFTVRDITRFGAPPDAAPAWLPNKADQPS